MPNSKTVAPINAENAFRQPNLMPTIGQTPPHHRAHRAEFASRPAADTTAVSGGWHRSGCNRCQVVAALLAAVTGSPTICYLGGGGLPTPPEGGSVPVAPGKR